MPKVISSLAKTYRLEGATLESDIKQLIDSKEIEGALKGGFFIPAKFLEKKGELVAKTLDNQGYIEYEWIEKNFMEKKPRDLLKNTSAKDLIYLHDMAISQRKM